MAMDCENCANLRGKMEGFRLLALVLIEHLREVEAVDQKTDHPPRS
jgi:hypothetical protein